MEKNQSFLVGEVLPQITEMTRPMIEPVSWTIDTDLGQSVEVLCDGAARVPTVRFDVGQLMQWPDIKSAEVMIRGIMLESEMSSVGSVMIETEATVAQYCSYIREILTENRAFSSRSVMKVSVLGDPYRLGKKIDNKDTTWIRLRVSGYTIVKLAGL